jgi:multidrug resistance efflux pump
MLSELSYKKADLERYQSLHDSKVVSTQEFESRKMEYLQYERNLKSIEISISQLKENITYIERDNRSNEITKTTEEINMYSKSIQSFNQLKKALKEWELKYAFIASLEGKVSFINIWNENQYVRNGDLLFTVVPQINSEYLARLKMPAQNFGKVKKGQEVMIRLENFPDNEFGILSGTVENMSLIPDNNGLYIIEVGLGDKLITNYNKEIDFTQEMSGTAEIITEDLRLIERFFYQLKGLLNRG